MATFSGQGALRAALLLMASPLLRADAFTERVRAAFEKAAPDLQLRIQSEDEIVLKGPGGDVVALLAKPRRACAQDPAGCDASIQAFVAQVISATRATGKTPFVASKVLPVLRTVEELRAPVSPGEDEMERRTVHGPFLRQLVQAYVVNAPPVIRYVNAKDLESAGITEEALRKTAFANVATLSQVKVEAVQGVQGLFMAVGGNGLGTCLIFDPRLWQDLEKQAGGPVAAACPARDWVFAARLDDPEALKSLRSFSAFVAKREAYPLPTVVFTRSGDGWREVAP